MYLLRNANREAHFPPVMGFKYPKTGTLIGFAAPRGHRADNPAKAAQSLPACRVFTGARDAAYVLER